MMLAATPYDPISYFCLDADFRLPVNIPEDLITVGYGTIRPSAPATTGPPAGEACLLPAPGRSGQDGSASASRAPKAEPDGTRSVPSLVSSSSMPARASASTAASEWATSTVT